MKIPLLFAPLLCMAGCATLQNSANSPPETEPDQVMVEAKFTEAGVLLSAPRIIAISGEERSEEHTSELQSRRNLVCRLLL